MDGCCGESSQLAWSVRRENGWVREDWGTGIGPGSVHVAGNPWISDFQATLVVVCKMGRFVYTRYSTVRTKN